MLWGKRWRCFGWDQTHPGPAMVQLKVTWESLIYTHQHIVFCLEGQRRVYSQPENSVSKKRTHVAWIDLLLGIIVSTNWSAFFGYYISKSCCALSRLTGRSGNLPQLFGNTCLHSHGICNSSRPGKQPVSMSALNCAATLTAKRSSDIKPVSRDAIGQACEVKSRRGENGYAPAAQGLCHQDTLQTFAGKTRGHNRTINH